jgi:hypothetical protein
VPRNSQFLKYQIGACSALGGGSVLLFNSAIVLIDWPAKTGVRQLQNADMDGVAENVVLQEIRCRR